MPDAPQGGGVVEAMEYAAQCCEGRAASLTDVTARNEAEKCAANIRYHARNAHLVPALSALAAQADAGDRVVDDLLPECCGQYGKTQMWYCGRCPCDDALASYVGNPAQRRIILTRLASLRAALATAEVRLMSAEGMAELWRDKYNEIRVVMIEVADENVALKAEREALAKALGELRSEMPATCVCDAAYSGRHLSDPQCGYHDYGAFCLGIIDTALAGRKVRPAGAEQREG